MDVVNSRTFTQADIDAKLLTYDHDGGENTSDSFVFNLTDGDTPVSDQTFKITVTPVNDAPEVITNNLLIVNQGGKGVIPRCGDKDS